MPVRPDVTGLTPAQAARELGLTPQRVRQLADGGHLAYTMTPLGRLLDPADVARLAQERAQQAAARQESAQP